MKIKVSTRGFTLVELIVVQLIIGILLLITIPQARLLLEKSRMQRLDERAQSLYLLMQNRLSRLKEGGEIERLRELSVSAAGAAGEFYLAFGSPELFPLCKGEAETFGPITELLGINKLVDNSLKAVCFVAEYRPAEGIISAVFCSDRVFNYNQAGGDNVLLMEGAEGWEDWRRENRIGCYGAANNWDNESTVSGRIITGLRLVNGEELLLIVKAAVSSEAEFTDFNPENWRLEVRVTGEDSGASLTFRESDSAYIKQISALSGSISYTAYLDDPASGRGFTLLYSGLSPGENLIIEVRLSYLGCEARLTRGEAKGGPINSMFYAKDGEYYIVSNNRHLYNEAFLPEGSFRQLGDIA
jgi:prepilin-type N-terminal cleavage/methylation domain-containing protein